MKKSLFNEYEAYTPEGSKLDQEFVDLVKDFIKEKCQLHSSVEVEKILYDTIGNLCCTERMKNALELRKRKLEEE